LNAFRVRAEVAPRANLRYEECGCANSHQSHIEQIECQYDFTPFGSELRLHHGI
jgi:hypothetical protein